MTQKARGNAANYARCIADFVQTMNAAGYADYITPYEPQPEPEPTQLPETVQQAAPQPEKKVNIIPRDTIAIICIMAVKTRKC